MDAFRTAVLASREKAMSGLTSLVTAEHVHRFERDGFFVLDNAISPQDLQALRGECQRFIDDRDREMDQRGVAVLDLDHRGRRYFLPAYARSETVRRFLAGEVMVTLASALLGDTVYLFNEQYVIKSAERGMRFSWHQDSGFIDYPHAPYLSCWIALDDVTEANGTVYLLPYERAGTRAVVPHWRDDQTHDRIGYAGTDPGDPVIAPAGSIACFSSTVLHRSGANTTDRMRRVYLAQYSTEPILAADRTALRHLAIPLLANGRPVNNATNNPALP
jgi:ectoine hydroxylase-related dioxygenase (phytanoyl-CoA dioxygenase family)